MNWKLPFDIPLITPTLGLPLEFFSILGIIVFVVHICFIYMLIGASTASVIYNIMGVFKKDSSEARVKYLNLLQKQRLEETGFKADYIL